MPWLVVRRGSAYEGDHAHNFYPSAITWGSWALACLVIHRYTLAEGACHSKTRRRSNARDRRALLLSPLIRFFDPSPTSSTQMSGQQRGNAPRLLYAAKQGNVQALQTLLAEGCDVNEVNVIGQNALHVAALWGNQDAVAFLLLTGCDMDAQNRSGLTPLHLASGCGMANCVRLLLDAGADPTLTTSDGRTAGDDAKNEQVAALLSPRLDVHDAVKNLDARKIKDLMLSGHKGFERLDADGNTALHCAVDAAETNQQISLAMINAFCGLADAGVLAKVLTKRSTKAGTTPLHLACQKGNAAIVKALIDAGNMVGVARRHNLDRRTVRVDGFNDGTWGKKNENGTLSLLENEDATPMHVALARLARECDDQNVMAPKKIHEEMDTCYEIIKLLIRNGANVDALDRTGASALHLAVASNLLKTADLLLSHRASLRIGGKFIGTGNNALHHAVQVGNPEMVTKIVTHAGKNLLLDIDAFGSGGWSALGLAVRVGNVSVVDTLLAAGANGNLPMGNGKSPLEIARVNKRACIIEAIRKREQISA